MKRDELLMLAAIAAGLWWLSRRQALASQQQYAGSVPAGGQVSQWAGTLMDPAVRAQIIASKGYRQGATF